MEEIKCNMPKCENTFSPWSDWSECSKPCVTNVKEKSIKQRSRLCLDCDQDIDSKFVLILAFIKLLFPMNMFLIKMCNYLEKLLLEVRECAQSFCLPKCPSYHLTELRKQDDDPSKFVASFNIERATYPIGELQYQRLRLLPKDFSENDHQNLESTEFNTTRTQSEVHVRNLIRRITYLPLYEFQIALNSTEMKDLTKFTWECKGQVKV